VVIPQAEFGQGFLFKKLKEFFGDKGVYFLKIAYDRLWLVFFNRFEFFYLISVKREVISGW
jgi:hypothetical protein